MNVIMNAKIVKNLKKFRSITLNQLNATASFLKRKDRKYLLTLWQFNEIIEDLKSKFKVLEIDNKKIFTYDNVYMDTPDYLFYKQHQDRLKSRTKIRTRYYIESNLAFFEYKQKVNWITHKYRYDFPPEEHGFMTKWKKRFFDWVWQSIYSGKKAPEISPSIKTKYRRITMVNSLWDERLTIDFDIKAFDLRKKTNKTVDLKNLVIIESKALKNNCEIMDIMKKYEINQARSCSKYSLWIVYSGLAQKYDTFKETMAKIKEIRMESVKNKKRESYLKNIENIWAKKEIETKKIETA